MCRRWLLLGFAVVALSCAESQALNPPDPEPDADPVPASAEAVAPSAPATSPAVIDEGAAAPAVEPPAPAAVPVFAATVRPVDEVELGASWRSDCPIGIADLRAIDMTHWNDEGDVGDGTLVVHVDHADAVVSVFERLFAAGFPIHSMYPVSAYDGDDDASMTANNTSAFNCRTISGTSTWSQHAFGGAIDINPLVNPWVRGSRVDPPQGAPYVDRAVDVPGLIRAGDAVTRAFADIGWGWGGDWTSTLDYQHFSHNGR